MTVADAGLRYVNRPGGVKSYDLWRLDQLNEIMGDYSIRRAAEGWSEFKRTRCAGLAPATVERFRAVLQAVLNYAAAEEQFEAPKIRRTERLKKKRIRFLPKDQQELLISSYARHVMPIAVALCFQGLRVGEALRLDWVHVDWGANSLFILPETKNGEARTVTMHPRVRSRNRTLRPANAQVSLIFVSMIGATTGLAGASCLASISKPSGRKAAGSPCGWSNVTPLSARRIGAKPCGNSSKAGHWLGNLPE
jgi:integrase